MGYEVVLYPPVLSYLEQLRDEEKHRCWEAITALERDPFRSRPGVDIKRWKDARFDYRLRKGRHRFGYKVAKKDRTIHVLKGWFK